MNIYIASDFHLKFHENSEDKKRRETVIRFLDSIKHDCDLLILNGDIFDLWFDWDTVIIKGYFRILRKFAELADSGIRLVLISGNHDFWFQDFLTEYIGMEIYEDNFTLDSPVSLFCSHGDLFTSNDFRYKFFRRLIRNKVVKFIFKILHPDISLNIGRFLSRSSRSRTISPALKEKKEKGLIHKAEELFRD